MDNINPVQNRLGVSAAKFSLASLMSRPLMHVVVIILIVLAIYSNTYNAPFELDDYAYIVEYLAIKNPQSLLTSLEDIKSSVITPGAFKNGMMTRPLAFLSFAVNYKLNGLNVVGYHIVNILIHLANALLVYSFVLLGFQTPFFRRFSNSHDKAQVSLVPGVAFFAAILFAVHPIQTQAVTYIVQRFASLATFFFLLTLVLYIKSYTSQTLFYKRGLYLISFVSAVLAMLTKEIAFTLPAIIMLLELMFLDGVLTRRLSRCAPFFLTMAIIPYNIVNSKSIIAEAEALTGSLNALAGNPTLSNIDYLLTEFRVIVTYLRLLLLPVNQNLDYDYPVFHSLLSPPVVASLALLTTIIVAGIYLWYKSTKIKSIEAYFCRLAAFGIFWFFITLSVESSVISIESVIYEHRMYLPSIGFFLVMVSFITIGMTRISSVTVYKTGIIATALVIVTTLAGATYARNRVWGAKITLWEDVVRKSPARSRGHINLAVAYADSNRLDEAEKECSTAVQLATDYDDAEKKNSTGVQLNPADYSRMYYNLGALNNKKKQYLKAISFFRMALNANNSLMPAHIAIGKIYQEQGLLVEAAKEYKIVNRQDNNFFSAHYNLGMVYYNLGEYENAIKEYSEALRMNPGFAPLYNSMGITYFRLGSSEKAVSMLKKALQLDPANLNALSNLQKITFNK